MTRYLTFLLTWWGLALFSALDSSLVFFMPFGVDAIVIYLASRNQELFWLYPLVAAAGSLAGTAVTYWIGRAAGDAGLPRLIPERRLKRLQGRVRDQGAIALALPALLPPPFPLTPFVLTCGALKVNPWRFFPAFGVIRLIRFSISTALALIYGPSIVRVLESDRVQVVVIGFVMLAVIGTIASGVVLWRRTRTPVLSGA